MLRTGMCCGMALLVGGCASAGGTRATRVTAATTSTSIATTRAATGTCSRADLIVQPHKPMPHPERVSRQLDLIAGDRLDPPGAARPTVTAAAAWAILGRHATGNGHPRLLLANYMSAGNDSLTLVWVAYVRDMPFAFVGDGPGPGSVGPTGPSNHSSTTPATLPHPVCHRITAYVVLDANTGQELVEAAG